MNMQYLTNKYQFIITHNYINVSGYYFNKSSYNLLSYLTYQHDRKFPIYFTISRRKLYTHWLFGNIYQQSRISSLGKRHQYLVLVLSDCSKNIKTFRVPFLKHCENEALFELFCRCRIWIEQGECYG